MRRVQCRSERDETRRQLTSEGEPLVSQKSDEKHARREVRAGRCYE